MAQMRTLVATEKEAIAKQRQAAKDQATITKDEDSEAKMHREVVDRELSMHQAVLQRIRERREVSKKSVEEGEKQAKEATAQLARALATPLDLNWREFLAEFFRPDA